MQYAKLARNRTVSNVTRRHDDIIFLPLLSLFFYINFESGRAECKKEMGKWEKSTFDREKSTRKGM